MKNITLGAMLAFFLAGTLSAQTLAQLEKSDYTKLENSDSQVTYYADNADYQINSAGKVSAQIMSFHKDGSLEEQGALLEGQKHGKWIKYDEAGNLMNSGSYLLGQKNGEWKVWEGEVLRVEMAFDKGQRVGTWKMFDAEGNLTAEKTY